MSEETFKKPQLKLRESFSRQGSQLLCRPVTGNSVCRNDTGTPNYKNQMEDSKNNDEVESNRYFLEEEIYLDKMAQIIRRDFFPEKLCEAQDDIDKKLVGVSLNDFVRIYKSEDNETFQKIMEKEEKRWRDKYWWMFLAEKKNRVQQLALENGDNKEKDNIRRMLKPQPDKKLAISDVESQSSMFFMPQYLPSVEQQPSQQDCIEDTTKSLGKINYQNTRFDETTLANSSAISVKKIVTHLNQDTDQARLSTPFLNGMENSRDLTKLKLPFRYNLEELMHGKSILSQTKEQPIINGYQIQAMPSPAPCDMPSPFITWGSVEDDPIQLHEKTAFRIKAETPREKVANTLTNSLQKTKVIQKKINHDLLKKAISSGTPLKVATILSSAHLNSLAKSILQRGNPSGKRLSSVNPLNTPLSNGIIIKTPSGAIKEIKMSPQHLTVESNTSNQEENKQTPLLRF